MVMDVVMFGYRAQYLYMEFCFLSGGILSERLRERKFRYQKEVESLRKYGVNCLARYVL